MKKIIYLLALSILTGGAISISGTTTAQTGQTKPVTVNLKNAQGEKRRHRNLQFLLPQPACAFSSTS